MFIISILIFSIGLYANDYIRDEFISKINKENEWIPIEYLDVMKSKNRETMKIIAPQLNYEKEWDDLDDCWKEWYERYIEYYEIERIFFDESIGISMSGNQKINKLEINKQYDYEIISIKKTSYYYILLKQDSASIFNYNYERSFISPIKELRQTPLYSENPDYYDNDEYKYDEIVIDAKFIFDEDYLTVYANNDKFKQVYFRCTDETFEQLKSLIYTNTIDLTRVTWPRHADGTCDYEEGKILVAPSSSATNVSINKTMSVKENLKLRLAEATTSTVLNVMAAGTKVKVLELGKAETIDGINSNWVKVEIISGKDRNGNVIRSGTTGWCYGGYLQ